VEWVRAWVPHARKRLMEIAKVMRRYPWMVRVVRQRSVGTLHPYMVEVYAEVDGSEVCLSLNQLKAFCARGGAVKEVKLELAFSRYEVYEGKVREMYRPKGLLAFTTATREYVKPLRPPLYVFCIENRCLIRRQPPAERFAGLDLGSP
jgi:hypothetical protein